MNEHTEQNINEAIDWLQQTGGSIQDFATTQAPLYCQEVVAWTFWMGFICTMIGTGVLVVGIYFTSRLPKWLKEDKGDPTARSIIAIFGGVLGLIIGGFTIASHLGDTIKAKVAPRIVIVEHLRGLNK
jgi:hypothetical protein